MQFYYILPSEYTFFSKGQELRDVMFIVDLKTWKLIPVTLKASWLAISCKNSCRLIEIVSYSCPTCAIKTISDKNQFAQTNKETMF